MVEESWAAISSKGGSAGSGVLLNAVVILLPCWPLGTIMHSNYISAPPPLPRWRTVTVVICKHDVLDGRLVYLSRVSAMMPVLSPAIAIGSEISFRLEHS